MPDWRPNDALRPVGCREFGAPQWPPRQNVPFDPHLCGSAVHLNVQHLQSILGYIQSTYLQLVLEMNGQRSSRSSLFLKLGIPTFLARFVRLFPTTLVSDIRC